MPNFKNLPADEIQRQAEEAEQDEARRTIKGRQRKALRPPQNPSPNLHRKRVRKETKPL